MARDKMSHFNGLPVAELSVEKSRARSANEPLREMMFSDAFAKGRQLSPEEVRTAELRLAMAAVSPAAAQELRQRLALKVGPGRHSVEVLNRAVLEAILEIADEQIRELALLIEQET